MWNRDFSLITSANLLMAVPFYFMTVLLPLFLSGPLGCSDQWVGIVMSSYTVASILARPVTGALVDSLNRRTIYVLTFSLFTLCFLGYPWVAGLGSMLALRFLHGVGWGSMSTASHSVAIELMPLSRRGEGIGIFGLSMPLAMALGPWLGLWIYGETGSFDVTFYVAACICALGLGLGLGVRVPEHAHGRSVKRLMVKLKPSNLFLRRSLGASLVVFVLQVPYGSIMSFITLYAVEIGEDVSSAVFFAVYSVGVLLTRLFAGRIFDRQGPRWLVLVGCVLCFMGYALLSQFPTAMVYYLSALPLGLGYGITSPPLQAMANRGVHERDRGAANSTFLTFFDIGIGTGMVVFGALIGTFGYRVAFGVGSALILIGYALFRFWIYPAYRRAGGLGKGLTFEKAI